MKYGDMTLGQVEALINKLGGMEYVKGILSGKFVVHLSKRIWNTWKVLPFDPDKKTVQDFRYAITSAGIKITNTANQMLDRIFIRQIFEKVDLVMLSVSDFGFKHNPTRKEIYIRAQEFGLHFCPPETALFLCLHYLQTQPKDTWLVIGMDPIEVNNCLYLFGVSNDEGGHCLVSYLGDPDYSYSQDSLFVFIK